LGLVLFWHWYIEKLITVCATVLSLNGKDTGRLNSQDCTTNSVQTYAHVLTQGIFGYPALAIAISVSQHVHHNAEIER